MPTLRRFASVIALGLAVAASSAGANDIQDINQLFRKGELNEALNRANQYLVKNPKDAQVRFLRGLILADQNKTADAIQAFTGLTEDYPELPEPYNNLAVLYAAQGKYDAARTALEMAIRTHPSYATAHENLGDLYAKMASIAYDKALQLDNSNTSAQTKLALIKDLMTGGRNPGPAKTMTSATPEPVKPASAKPAASSSDTPSPDRIIETVQGWAKAWSAKDVDAYLAYYAPDFKPAAGSRTAWEAERRERVGKAEGVSVQVSNIHIKPDGADRATVEFRQKYRSKHLRNISTKRLDLLRSGDRWLIMQESGR
ncbi:MAG TPA: tetratricopeptide repeat protein [Thiobacillaceae bacterium]|nr:tetratricopeptide repeat protein [Thiobacillaceae bacterium]